MMDTYGELFARLQRQFGAANQGALPFTQGVAVLLAAALVGHLLLGWFTQRETAAPLPPVVSTDPVVVHVAGEVPRPGLYQLAGGARVADAINAAGGPGTNADLSAVNLARVLEDGEQLRVPGPGSPRSASLGAAAGPDDGKVDLNRASAAELERLPGIGQVLAARIVAYREQHGGFQTVRDLRRVNGIGEKLYKSLVELVTL